MWGRIQSLVLLGLALVKTLLLRLGSRENSVAKFNAVYGAEGILSVTANEAAVLREAGRCVACGRCDAREARRISQSRVGYRGMMAFALSGARSLTDSAASALVISELEDEDFAAAEALCPEAVPLLSLSRLVRGHASRLAETRTVSQPAS